MRVIVLTLLAVDGVICAIVGALLLPTRLGTVPFPVSAFAVGLMLLGLVWVASHWTDSTRLAAVPLWAWLAATAVLTLGGPGGDVVFSTADAMPAVGLLYLVVGVGPSVWLLRRGGRFA